MPLRPIATKSKSKSGKTKTTNKKYSGVLERYRASDNVCTGYYLSYRDADSKSCKHSIDAKDRDDALLQLMQIKAQVKRDKARGESSTKNRIDQVEKHPVATYIGIFDHYAHTSSLVDSTIAEDILDAKNVMLCFGKELTSPEVLAVRPRAIGIAEMKESFVISFLEAPNPAANEAMINWTKALIRS